MLTIGLVVNPLAGVGGPAAMKGSDGEQAQQVARKQGIEPAALTRARAMFAELAVVLESVNRPAFELRAAAGAMGLAAAVDVAEKDGQPLFATVEVGTTPDVTSAADTKAMVTQLLPQVDLLVFGGGDGTARDVLDARKTLGADVDPTTPVLGIPAGVKMHSGVFATSPRAAAALIAQLLGGGLISATLAEVKDIDEAALRLGRTGSVTYGELPVPAEGGYLQHVKNGGVEVEELVLLEIAAEVAESLVIDTVPLVLGPGSTCFAIKQQLLGGGEAATLLGVDVVCDGELLVADANSAELRELQQAHERLSVVLSYSRGQGILLGRGNQQLDAIFLENLAQIDLHVVSSRTKLASLAGRPLLVDTGELALDQKFSGLRQIISGYQDKLLYLVELA